ncbi:MAG: hypothetical protein M1835_006372 [Candelina submexicana]|nr:MAG: hypothetical protein M1835_006372 [Candelina submexicana]
MGPRKKSKPNPKVEAPGNSLDPAAQHSATSQAPIQADKQDVKEGRGVESHTDDRDISEASRSTQSWYGGTWPRISKANPVTQIARESISVASAVATDLVSSARSRDATPVGIKSPSRDLIHTISNSTRSLPLAATTTKLNITSSTSQDTQGESNQQATTERNTTGRPPHGCSRRVSTSANESLAALKPDQIPLPTPNGSEKAEKDQANQSDQEEPKKDGSDRSTVEARVDGAEDIQRPSSAPPGWRGWFVKSTDGSIRRAAAKAALPEAPTEETPQPAKDPQEMSEARPATRNDDDQKKGLDALVPNEDPKQQARSWFGLWGGITQVPAVEMATNEVIKSQAVPHQKPLVVPEGGPHGGAQTPPDKVTKDGAEGNVIAEPDTTPRRSSGWAFWFKNQTSPDNGTRPPNSNLGELAVTDTPSQSQPEVTRYEHSKTTPSEEPAKPGKKGLKRSLEVPDDPLDRVAKPETSPRSPPSHSPAPSKSKLTDLVASKQSQKSLPNLVLPAFKSTYTEVQSPSMLQQITRLLLYSDQPAVKHINIVREPQRIKKALAIGVHGYFPAPVIRSVLGQPTGTSIRFADSAAHAIESWAEGRGYPCEIQKIALEGEGKIAERVEMLWKLILNWIDQISKADFILVACHSQGVPVAMMLVAKLINLGVVTSTRVGVCAMAGVNLGPFPDYKSRLFSSGSAGELFEFSRPESTVSKNYEESLRVAVKHGVRITYIGSIDDQLVSLESSTFSNISHPYIYRAVFVDGRVHAPDFITHLVGFALKLRNLGISDHGLIRELSSPLAGSLYSGEGHSRIYDEDAVYHLAVEHALESSTIGDVPLEVQKYEVATNHNPYILPWATRGLLEEEYVRTQMQSETTELLEQFDNWKPTSKVLKDVKFRLEAVKSKL